MDGRWTICGAGEHDEMGVVSHRAPWVEGPQLDPGATVPVVPCDDGAIERLDAWIAQCIKDDAWPTGESCVRALAGEAP